MSNKKYKNNYVTYHLHTECSLLDSCTNYKLYVNEAVELGQIAIAFTEHGNIYNWIEKKMYVNSKGLKYIHGCEVYLTEQLEPKVRDNYHTILLAKNYEGVKEINLLIGKSTDKEHMYYKPRISFDEFFNISDNVIKISACLASPLSKYPSFVMDQLESRIEELSVQKEETIQKLNEQCKKKQIEFDECVKQIKEINESYDKIVEQLKSSEIDRCRNVFNKLLQSYDYYEIQPHVKSLDQIKYNQMLYEASKQYGKPLIAGTDTHNLNQYKSECRKILLAAKDIKYTNEDDFDLTYKSYGELVDMFRQQGSLPMDMIYEAIENTNIMADSVEDFELDTSVKYPKLYDDEEAVFKKLINDKLQEKLDKGIIDRKKLPKYKANIREEMRVFKKINMISFMLFMSELVCWCWDNGIPVGFCRGSVGGSTIAYITDIIDVDPVVWNTIFSRFANEDREEVGDYFVNSLPLQKCKCKKHSEPRNLGCVRSIQFYVGNDILILMLTGKSKSKDMIIRWFL